MKIQQHNFILERKGGRIYRVYIPEKRGQIYKGFSWFCFFSSYFLDYKIYIVEDYT